MIGASLISMAILFAQLPSVFGPSGLPPKGIYCILGEENVWRLGTRAHPLVNRSKRTMFANIESEKGHVRTVHIHFVTPGYDLDTTYLYAPDGGLRSMSAFMKDSEFWYATADLLWSDRQIAQPRHVRYYDPKEGHEIAEPETCRPCRAPFESIKVYPATADLPFAQLLPEVERLNATQK